MTPLGHVILISSQRAEFEGLLWASLWVKVDSGWSMYNWEVRSISFSFCISFSPETTSAPARACGHFFSLFPRGVKVHNNSFPSFFFFCYTHTLRGGKSWTLLLLWFNPIVPWSRAWYLLSNEVGVLLKTRQPFSSSYKPFAIPFSLSLSSPSLLFFFAWAFWSHLCHSFEILLTAAHLKHGFWSLTMFFGHVKISRGRHELFVIAICIQTAGLHFICI